MDDRVKALFELVYYDVIAEGGGDAEVIIVIRDSMEAAHTEERSAVLHAADAFVAFLENRKIQTGLKREDCADGEYVCLHRGEDCIEFIAYGRDDAKPKRYTDLYIELWWYS